MARSVTTTSGRCSAAAATRAAPSEALARRSTAFGLCEQGGEAVPAQVDTYVEDYEASEHLSAGENFCGPWATTFHEARNGAYHVVTTPGGPDNAAVKVNGLIDGVLDLIPDDPALPTYHGTYREKINGLLSAFVEANENVRVTQYRLGSTLVGSDGSTLTLRLTGKFTLNAQGVVVVSHDTFTCS
jgi:hypothetical protein